MDKFRILGEYAHLISQCKQEKQSLQTQVDLGIITLGDALNEYAELSKKELALREKFVMAVHIKRNGEPRNISFHEASEDNPVSYWFTLMPDGKRKKNNTREGLILALYDHYTGALSDNSVRAIFKAALHEKAITENPKSTTIVRNDASFRALISEEFASTDIRQITLLYLKEYTQKWVNEKHPKKAVYLSYKGILNLIFDYAFAHGVISSNPVKGLKNKVYLKSCDTSRAKAEEKILSPEEIGMLKSEVRRRMQMKKYGRYYINGYALLFAIETGVRVGELCAIKWRDVYEDRIHIHSQQLCDKTKGYTDYYYVPYTKNEKGISEDGREFPLTDAIEAILTELRDLQQEMGIESEYVFCHENGEWIKTDAYITFLRRLCRSFGFKVTNNHALRMSLNSNVLLPLGISVADRAAMLGHSIETNLKFYSFAQKNYLTDVRNRLNRGFVDVNRSRDLSGTYKIVQFPPKAKAQNH